MKSAILLGTACLTVAVLHGSQSVPRRAEPFVPVAVSYRIEPARDRARTSADFEAIQALGFNSVRVPVEWTTTEPARGEYQFDALDRTLALAGQSGLKVILSLETASPPGWLIRRHPDGRFVSDAESAGTRLERACLDHPGVRADVEAYVGAVTSRAAGHAAWQALDLGSDLPDGFCLCQHTERRFRGWLKATFGSESRPPARAASDRAAFVALDRADQLGLLTAAASARGAKLSMSSVRAPSVLRQLLGGPPGQDDWLMTTVVDHAGTRVPPDAGSAANLTPPQLALGLDGIRSASRDKGWLMTLGAPLRPPPDDRLWTWAALARGARGVVYGDWRASLSSSSDGSPTDRARAAGTLARVIGRNPALFAPLRPRAAQVAIAYDPRTPAAGPASAALANVYRVLFERNIQADFIHIDEVAAGLASRYALVFVDSLSTLPEAASGALQAFAAAGGTFVSRAVPAPTGQQVVQLLARARVVPEVRIEGATGPVETRFLESSDVLMLIGLNHADTPQRVTLTFTPDTQEAIWQNMETGSAVNFVAGPEGPTYTYSFAPRDALVLMIRKSVR